MKDSGQQEFINTVKAALEKAPVASWGKAESLAGKMSAESRALLQRIQNRTPADRKKLLETFIKAAEPINLSVTACENRGAATAAIAELVRKKNPEWGEQKRVVAWVHPLVERLSLPAALSEQGVPLSFTDLKETDRESLRRQVIESFVGITSADFCMADTATLVMRTRPGCARSVSLLPSIHIAVIELYQIIADLKELYALLKWDPRERKEGLSNCMTFISGPSKTADIEATMVHGAHGPREVHVFVI